MNKQEIFIDTDMGNDDLMAICMFLSSKKFKVIGISVVNGVSRASTGSRNLARILTYLNITTVPVIQGFTKAMRKTWRVEFPLIDRQRANRLTLVKKVNIPKLYSKNIKRYYSTNEIFRIINKSPGKITLICLGPLTNVATVINKFGNRFINKIEKIVLMGGAVNVPGIVPPQDLAEYNMYLDPEAAKIVFDSGIPITMVPVDATKWVPADPKKTKNYAEKEVLEKFYKIVGFSKPSRGFGKIIKEIILNNKGDFNFFYDPLVSATLERPNMIQKSKNYNIRVSLFGLSRGVTKSEAYGEKNVCVVSRINAQKFYRLIIEKLK